MNTVVRIKRSLSDSKQTLGVLSVDIGGASFSCKTLELPWKNNEKNVSCIPRRIYDVKQTFSYKFMKFTYEILNVPNRSGIRMHSANYFYQLLGCISLGNGLQDLNGDGEIDVVNSRNTVVAFERFMKKGAFTLIIE